MIPILIISSIVSIWIGWTIVDRTLKYQEAEQFAKSVGKPLLVVGRPKGTIPVALHGCGDVCLDIDDCPECPNSVKSSVESIPFPDRYFGAAFVSHVLEHLDSEQVRRAWNELHRVADKVTVSHPIGPDIYNPGHKIQITKAENGILAWIPIPGR